MAYTERNACLTRDKYGNPVREPVRTEAHSTNHAAWAIGALVVLALLYAVFGSTTSVDTFTSSPTNTESSKQPATPSPAPSTP